MPIVLKKVAVHNLKKVDLTLETGRLIVFTGVSGSGKSSLAFDTIYVEGQRRYIESLSTYARRHLGDLPKPEAELISGISPTIAIEQKTAGNNPRSTVGTLTGIYDYMRVLYARIATAYCPVSGERVTPQSSEEILRQIEKLPEKSKILILAPYAKGKKAEFKEDFALLMRKGYTRLRLDGKLIDLSEEISVDGKVAHDLDLVIDRVVMGPGVRTRLAEAITQALEAGGGLMSIVNQDSGEEQLFSKHAYSPKSGLSYGPLEPHDFSFNHPAGMCPTCQGLGTILEFVLEKIIDPEKSVAEDCCSVASSFQTVRYGNIYKNLGFDVHTPWKKLSESSKKIFLYGNDKKWTRMHFVHPQKGTTWMEYVHWEGVLGEARRRYQEATSDLYRGKMQELMEESICPDCQGARIRPYPAAAQFEGKKIWELTNLSIDKLLHFFEHIHLSHEQESIAGELVKEIRQRLFFLNDVGLHYLSIERTAPTLSGGEAQRVRLASQIGAGLSKATYVLDEPSIGLHPRDNKKLIKSLRALCSKGNTVIVVEHDEETILAADTIVDVGPLAGQFGGEILCAGDLKALKNCSRSLTADYLFGLKSIPIPKKRRKPAEWLSIEGASHHNLKNITAKIPLKVFTAVTGVSGSGKSSLISDILYPALSNELLGSKLKIGKHHSIKGIETLDKVIAIDQTPIGRTPRSNPATYIKVFDDIRNLFAELPESRAEGYKSGRFSFNVKEGSCPYCGGLGMVKIDMDFMEDEWVACKQCGGRRFDQKTLSVQYRGQSIHDVLEMTIGQALPFFEPVPHIKRKLQLLSDVGLDYIRLGQSSTTLSGGEAQRIKLAKELSRPGNERTLYILDEPTTGLHFHDIHKLITVLQKLVDRGSSVLVIEHNMDLVKTADWIIDLGPEGGEGGGEIIANGTPEKIAKLNTPTGDALRPVLHPKPIDLQEAVHPPVRPTEGAIVVKGAQQNTLKEVDAHIPHGKITVCTGPSGSGKSSFAFETVYAEGQRRYTESLSAYSRQFVKQMPRPKIEEITGLMASIAIEQKSSAGNPRSTIGTMTEAYDFLRLIYAHLGTAYSPETGEEIRSISKEYVLEKLLELPLKTKVEIVAPLTLSAGESFETLQQRLLKEGFLRLRLNGEIHELDGPISYDKRRKNKLELVIDRLIIDPKAQKRIFDAIDAAAKIGGGTLIAVIEGEETFFNLAFAEASSGKSYAPITPHTFSFNTAQGMCPTCLGLGFEWGADLEGHRLIMKLSCTELMDKLWKEASSDEAMELFTLFLKKEKIDSDAPLSDLPSEQLKLILSGSPKTIWMASLKVHARFTGLSAVFAKMAKSSVSDIKDALRPWVTEIICPACKGSRLNPLASNVRLMGLSLPKLCLLPLQDADQFLQKIKLNEKQQFLEEPLRQLRARLHFLNAIGLGYLSLDRAAPTLSGGETQRIRLSRQLGTGLTGCLYVLDEPTIGLHPHNNALLGRAMQELCALGNTLLLVEHDPMTLELADYLLDFGPGAGKQGGQITARGTLAEIKKNPDSLTGAYLSGRKKIPLPSKRRTPKGFLELKHANLNNLKNLSLSLPLGTLTCLTGVSGSGKSSLMSDLIRPALQKSLAARSRSDLVEYKGATFSGLKQIDKLLATEQDPIGHTNRADVSTYVDLLTPMRHFFAQLPEAKARGLSAKHFSFNHRKGMCTSCWGLGTKKISLQFLPPVRVTCDSCHGYRFNPLTLQVKTKDKHLGQILQLTVDEALPWITPIPKVIRILETLSSVGLGYLSLGQEIATLSGGEAQRLRLATELAKRSSGKTLYLFDEPTIGLHSEDIARLLSIFHALVEKGHSIILIEHNLDVIANADYLIDLGPEAGPGGGQIVTMGTPEEVAKHPTSYTAHYLRDYLKSYKD